MKILLTDDDPCILELIIMLLKRNSISDDIKSTINALESKKWIMEEKYDLLLLDYKMPNLNGGDYIKNLRENSKLNRDIPVIFVSGRSQLNEIDLYKNTYLLNKLRMMSDLIPTIKEVMGI